MSDDRDDLVDRVLAAMGDDAWDGTTRGLCRLAGCSFRTAVRVLTVIQRMGLVLDIGDGYFALTASGHAAAQRARR